MTNTNSQEEVWTVLKLINWTKDYFQKAHFEDARLSAEVLLAHALHCRRIELYTRFDYIPTTAELGEFRETVQRARKYEPIAYIIGEKEFYSLRFKVTPEVLVPRSETEMLVREAVEHLKGLGRPGTAWDVCTGSGCVGIATASQVKDARVLGTDISETALTVANENAELNGVADRVRFRPADLLTLPEDCADLAPFDVITGNPPYVADNQMITEVVKAEPKVAIFGGPDGLNFIRPLVNKAHELLRPGGALIMEFGYAMADAVRDLTVGTGEFKEPKILSDHQGIERSMVAIRK